jgi:hypothetical protein
MPRIAEHPTKRLGGGARRRRLVLTCFGVMVLVTMLVTLVLFGALSGHGDVVSVNSGVHLFGRPTFSIIIPAKNEVVYISNTLHALGSDLKQVARRNRIAFVALSIGRTPIRPRSACGTRSYSSRSKRAAATARTTG